LRGGHDLGSLLTILIRDRTLMVVVVCLVLGTSPVLDVVMIGLGHTRDRNPDDFEAPTLRARDDNGRCSHEHRGRACSC
jgi:hypothetical protein